LPTQSSHDPSQYDGRVNRHLRIILGHEAELAISAISQRWPDRRCTRLKAVNGTGCYAA
jgi:hypothetical protein